MGIDESMRGAIILAVHNFFDVPIGPNIETAVIRKIDLKVGTRLGFLSEFGDMNPLDEPMVSIFVSASSIQFRTIKAVAVIKRRLKSPGVFRLHWQWVSKRCFD